MAASHYSNFRPTSGQSPDDQSAMKESGSVAAVNSLQGGINPVKLKLARSYDTHNHLILYHLDDAFVHRDLYLSRSDEDYGSGSNSPHPKPLSYEFCVHSKSALKL